MDLISDVAEGEQKNVIAQKSSEETNKQSFPCQNCGRLLQSKSGRTNHLKKCKDKKIAEKITEEEESSTVTSLTVTQLTSKSYEPSANDLIPPEPPDPLESSNSSIVFKWGQFDGDRIKKEIDEAYEIIVFWKKNLFLLPKGAPGKNISVRQPGLLMLLMHG